MKNVLLIASLISFTLAVFRVHVSVDLIALGLGLFVGAHLV